MLEEFFNRTVMHIALVNEIGAKLLPLIADQQPFLKQLKEHDASKFGEIEKIPYIHLTWFYKQKQKGVVYKYPDTMKDRIDVARLHHIKTNCHHPESFEKVSDMPLNCLAEMVADWAAMSVELNTSLLEWSEKTVPKYSFTGQQQLFIKKLICLTNLP